MPGNPHGWLMVADESGQVQELINHARTAAYLSHPDLSLDGISICDVLEYGGCENYAMVPSCDEDGEMVWTQEVYDTPASDGAPWYMNTLPESGDALGFWVEEWTGLDDRHAKREMRRYGRDRGGAAIGVITATERVMKLNVLLFARSEAAMMHLFRWFGSALSGVCQSCSSETILIRDWCGESEDPTVGLAELRDVALIEGLSWESDVFPRGSCLIRRASFTLAAGDPCMYRASSSPAQTTAADDLPQCLLDANYDLTRRPCRPSCSEQTSDCRAVWSWSAEEAVGARGPVVEFHNDHAEHAFPFRAILYHDPGAIGVSPNPCGLPILGELYVRALPPSSFLRWDVAGRQIDYHDPTTGGWVPGWPYIDGNDPPLRRYFVLPCDGDHHLVLEPATLCIERIGVTGNTFEWQGITFTDPHYPDVSLTTVERVSCP